MRISECQPLFFNAYRSRDAGAVIHSHSMWAVLAARLAGVSSRPAEPGAGPIAGEFRSRDLEMQKGLRGHGCFDELRVPIIANTAREAQLTESMAAAIDAYPDVDAVIVAGHGIYVWGRDWVQAKTQAECLDFLLRVAVEGHRVGLARAKEREMQLAWIELPQRTARLPHPRRRVPARRAASPTSASISTRARTGAALDRVKRERGYVEEDIVELAPTTENLEGICAKFADEHLHTDDEVRFVLAGAGIFDIRDDADRWMRVTVEPGDLIVVPRDRHHRFFLTDAKQIRCVRLFQSTAGWVPHYR